MVKKVTQKEILELINVKEFNTEDLIKLRNMITTELEVRDRKKLFFPKEYKSVVTYDQAIPATNKKVKFIMDEDGILLGTDQDLGLYMGKVNKNLNIIIFYFSLNYEPLVFNGILDSSYKYYSCGRWYMLDDFNYEINKFNNLDNNKFSNWSVYDNLIDEHIPNLENLVSLSFQRFVRNDKILEIMDVLRDGKKTKIKQKTL